MEIPAQDGSYVSRESEKGTQSEVGFKLTPYKLSLLHALGCYLSASSMGSRLRSAVSLGSLNHDFIGIALSMRENKTRTILQNNHFYGSLFTALNKTIKRSL